MTARSPIAHEPWAIVPEMLARVVSTAREAAKSGTAGRAATPGPPRTSQRVAVLPLYGVLVARDGPLARWVGATPLDVWQRALRIIDASSQVDAIVLDVDSPGGSTALVTETAAMIRKARTPTVAVANTLAGSAGYWLAAQADEVVASPSSMLGSIGVYAVHEDFSVMQQKAGVKTTLVSAGTYKTDGNPWEPLSESGRETIDTLVQAAYGSFVLDVAVGRGVGPSAVRDGFGQGRLVTAASAVKLGMADRVATLDQTIARLERGDLPAARGSRPSSLAARSSSTVDAIRAQLALIEGRSS